MRWLSRVSPRVRTWAIWAVIALLAVAVLATLLRPQAVRVDTGVVDEGSLKTTVEGEGRTRVRQRYVVSAMVAGRLERVDLMENDAVKRGQIVARIDPLPTLSAIAEDEARIGEIQSQRAGVSTLRPKNETIGQARASVVAAAADQRVAQARLSEAGAQLAQAHRDRTRMHTLYHGGYVPLVDLEKADLDASTHESQVDAATLAARAADARVDQARQALGEVIAKISDPNYLIGVYDAQIAATQADLLKLREDARRTVLRSPADGRVLRVVQRSEDFVGAGAPVLEVGDPNRLELVVELLSTDAVGVRPGAAMTIDDGSSTWRFAGRVRYVEASAFTKISALGVEEQRVNVVGEFVGAHSGFGDGYRIEARIVTWRAANVLRVPSAALFQCERDWCVYAIERGRARLRHVALDHLGENSAQVLSGLSRGAIVVLHPTEKVTDGAAVSTDVAGAANTDH